MLSRKDRIVQLFNLVPIGLGLDAYQVRDIVGGWFAPYADLQLLEQEGILVSSFDPSGYPRQCRYRRSTEPSKSSYV